MWALQKATGDVKAVYLSQRNVSKIYKQHVQPLLSCLFQAEQSKISLRWGEFLNVILTVSLINILQILSCSDAKKKT